MDSDILRKLALKTRKEIFKFKTTSGAGHLATCLSCVDILCSMYYDDGTFFNHKSDKLIFSKGHGSPAVYPILADLGYFPETELAKYCTPEGILRLHADNSIPGCNFVGGSLGNGIGYAAGIARESDDYVFAILGDAELYEGAVWESLLFIAHHNLTNLYAIVDRNQLGILGKTEDLLRLEPLMEKIESFGLHCEEIDGHNFDDLRNVLSKEPEKPTVIIANTIKGKGVSYMEGKWEYHTIIPKEKHLIDQGLAELS